MCAYRYVSIPPGDSLLICNDSYCIILNLSVQRVMIRHTYSPFLYVHQELHASVHYLQPDMGHSRSIKHQCHWQTLKDL